MSRNHRISSIKYRPVFSLSCIVLCCCLSFIPICRRPTLSERCLCAHVAEFETFLTILSFKHQENALIKIQQNTSQHTSYQMPTTSCFGIKVPLSGSFSAKIVSQVQVFQALFAHTSVIKVVEVSSRIFFLTFTGFPKRWREWCDVRTKFMGSLQ